MTRRRVTVGVVLGTAALTLALFALNLAVVRLIDELAGDTS